MAAKLPGRGGGVELNAGHAPQRRYDLDWLRIGAFGALILYHVGLYYATWEWILKSRYSSTAVEPFMGLISSLASLFFISGVALRFMIDKAPLGRLLQERVVRLFLPLAFGSLVICAPQTYVALRYLGEIPPGFPEFYRDYLGLGQYAFSLPDAHHLWYVRAILTYTLITVAFLPVLRGATNALGAPFFRWLAAGRAWRMLFVPALPFFFYIAVLDIYLSPAGFGAWADPARTFTFFLIGFMAAKNDDFWKAVDSALPISIGLSIVLAGMSLAAWMYQFDIGNDSELLYAALLLRPFYSWSVLVMLLGLAGRFANRGSPVLTYLTAAIFPYFILHQTIIVLVGYWFTLHEVPLPVEAGTILGATIVGCAVGYEIIRRAGPVRLLFGLPLHSKNSRLQKNPEAAS